MTELLRDDWGFNGFVVTDYTGINEMIEHGMGDLQQVSALALKAGSDMDMVGEGFLTTLSKSLEEGTLSIDVIDTAVKRILTAKYQFGIILMILTNIVMYQDLRKRCSQRKIELSLERLGPNQWILMKNDNNLLPLKKEEQ